ncbi:PAS domain S-box protein [Gorillibacterium sp. sgz5001074]|uniref:PAS domain S-box protein n=1 Tax=Gorillibacterium sp. sgz5001074 TaxID=3446695 RepID=UPI003F674711
MIKELIANVSLLISTLFVWGQLLRNPRLGRMRYKRCTMGIMLGATALILMHSGINIWIDGQKIVIDLRNVIIVLSALYGGLPSMLLTVVTIVTGRLLYLGINGTLLLAAVSALLIGFSAWGVSRLKLREIWAFNLANLLSVGVGIGFILVLLPGYPGRLELISLYSIVSIAGGMLAFSIVRYLRHSYQLQDLVMENEQKYGSLFRNNLDAVCSFDVEGRFVTANPSAERLTGYTVEELRGMRFLDLVPSEEKSRILDLFSGALRGRPLQSELRLVHRSGRIVHILGNPIPIVVHGRIIGVHGVGKDITELKRAEAELKASKMRTEAILESITDGFFALDAEGRFTYVNHESERILNRSRDKLIGRVIWEMSPELVETHFHERCMACMSGGEPVSFQEFYAPAGIWFQIRIYPNAEGLSVYLHDITQSKLAEDALRDSEERFRLLVEHATDLICRLDETGVPTYLTPYCRTLLGYEPEELAGIQIYDYVHPDDAEVLRTNALQAAGAEVFHHPELRFLKKDGSYVWVEARSKGVLDEAGALKEIVVSVRDITRRRKADEALRRVNEELRRLSSLDGVTGIPNRRHLDEVLEREWTLAVQGNKPLSLVMLDIDYFKPYNDTYGHLGGDLCLKGVAGALQSAMRSRDFAARYGGEEFVALLPDTGEKTALTIGERIRASAEGLRIPHAGSEIHPFMTVSVGVATVYPAPGGSPEELVDLTDKALYQAKLEGRNRVCSSRAG